MVPALTGLIDQAAITLEHLAGPSMTIMTCITSADQAAITPGHPAVPFLTMMTCTSPTEQAASPAEVP